MCSAPENRRDGNEKGSEREGSDDARLKASNRRGVRDDRLDSGALCGGLGNDWGQKLLDLRAINLRIGADADDVSSLFDSQVF